MEGCRFSTLSWSCICLIGASLHFGKEIDVYVPDFWTKIGRDDNLSSVSFETETFFFLRVCFKS